MIDSTEGPNAAMNVHIIIVLNDKLTGSMCILGFEFH